VSEEHGALRGQVQSPLEPFPPYPTLTLEPLPTHPTLEPLPRAPHPRAQARGAVSLGDARRFRPRRDASRPGRGVSRWQIQELQRRITTISEVRPALPPLLFPIRAPLPYRRAPYRPARKVATTLSPATASLWISQRWRIL